MPVLLMRHCAAAIAVSAKVTPTLPPRTGCCTAECVNTADDDDDGTGDDNRPFLCTTAHFTQFTRVYADAVSIIAIQEK